MRCQLMVCRYKNIPAITPEIAADSVKPGKNIVPELSNVLLIKSLIIIDNAPIHGPSTKPIKAVAINPSPIFRTAGSPIDSFSKMICRAVSIAASTISLVSSLGPCSDSNFIVNIPLNSFCQGTTLTMASGGECGKYKQP